MDGQKRIDVSNPIYMMSDAPTPEPARIAPALAPAGDPHPWTDPITGKFKPGNPGSPGRPPRTTEQHYLDILRRALTDEKWQGIVEKAIAQATKGDRWAREWLAQYGIGRPAQYIQADLTTGGQPLPAIYLPQVVIPLLVAPDSTPAGVVVDSPRVVVLTEGQETAPDTGGVA